MTRLEKELAGLATSSPVQLRERWEVGGAESAPLVPTTLLRRLLAQRLQEKRHDSLPLMVARELDVEPQQVVHGLVEAADGGLGL